MATRFYYTDLSDNTLCEHHMAENLAAWFPETADRVAGPMVAYEGHDAETLRTALIESGEITSTNVQRIGTRVGDVGHHCDAMH